ncbi:MAG: ABC transporter substrate-binding protein [Dehalococcoidales bacterium]|nr:ABC transporter substrate-binding protein [Dehalococcoidales bacterium]
MKERITWLIISSLVVLSMVAAACGAPAVTEEPKIETPKVETPAVEEPEVVEPTVDKPKYGGQFRDTWLDKNVASFDPGVAGTSSSMSLFITNEVLVYYDWTKGPAGGYGTHESDFTARLQIAKLQRGALVESWGYPTKIEGDMGTVTLHVRKGIHWALNPQSEASQLVGGRELTADDIVSGLNRIIQNPKSEARNKLAILAEVKITSPEDGVVKMEIPWASFKSALDRLMSQQPIAPPEVFAKYGNMSDWRHSVGTGPFMLTDFVPSATTTYVRNPNYWDNDPIGPGKGNQLPYLDGVKMYIIPDRSTQTAALRTGKIDILGGFVRAERDLMLKTRTELKWSTAPPNGSSAIGMKLENPPFNDIRVRQALMLATDFETIKRDYFGGDAQINTFPIVETPEFRDAYLALDDLEMPSSVKELYVYNPEKAKQLLAEAGYPQGFKTNIRFSSDEKDADYFSIIKDMWAKVDVDLELRPMEAGAWETARRLRDFDQMFTTGSATIGQIYEMANFRPSIQNVSGVDDPLINQTYEKIQAAVAIPGIGGGETEANRLYKEMLPHALGQVYAIPEVQENTYNMWWPWVKNYSGELYIGIGIENVGKYIWIDQELKKELGY